MAWILKDEFIDLAQARHVVIFHNPDTGAEHHLVNAFGLPSCPHCGHVKAAVGVDFHKVKADTLTALNEHHQQVMRYREQHPGVKAK